MPFSHLLFRHPEDIPDTEVRKLRRLGFGAAIQVLERWSQEARPRETQLDFIESLVLESGVSDVASLRYTVAQAAQFLSQPDYFFEYVPEEGLSDEVWLRFMVENKGVSDIELAFQLARVAGQGGLPDFGAVRRAREKLGVVANVKSSDDDTISILDGLSQEELNPRLLLSHREWMEERVLRRDMSDGDIARELSKVGFSCDRSTVRLYRNMLGLQRATYARKPASPEE